MPLDVVVCLKQVVHPDYLGKVALDPETGTLDRAGVPAVINPADRNALEEALRLRERWSGEVTALTMGPPQARKALEEALAMGADGAVHLCDAAFAGADTLATARVLAAALQKMGRFDIVLCGGATIDSGTAQVPLQVAELLGLPCVTDVTEVAIEDERTLLVGRAWGQGRIRARMSLPGLVAVSSGINRPRLPTVLDIMAATQKGIAEWRAADIGLHPDCVGLAGSPTRVHELCQFHASRGGELLSGPPEEAVETALSRLAELEVL
jgi:electron transfer flavoprotein beta subunit